MSKTIPVNLAAHYALGSTLLAHALKVTRTDGQVFAFTSASEDVTLSSVLHRSAPGLDVSEITLSAGLAVDNLELTTLHDGTTFTRADVLGGKWRNAAFVISKYNQLAPADGVDVLITGTFGEVFLQRGQVIAELRGLQQWLQQPVGNVSSKTCRARLGDSLCTVALGPFTVADTVATVASNQVFASSALTPVPGDSDYASVVLLLHGEGTHASTTFTDNSASPKTPTVVGDAQLSTAQFKYGAASMLFDGLGDYLSYAHSTDWDFGTGNFTLEAWVRLPVVSGTQMILGRQEVGAGMALQFAVESGGLSLVLRSLGGTGLIVITGGTLVANTWHHVAACRSGGTVRIFVDGAVVNSSATSNTITAGSARPLTVGMLNDGTINSPFSGHMDDVRITKGVGRYTGAFTPPAAAHYDSAPYMGGLYAVGWFNEGVLTFTSGANAGLKQKVKAYDALGNYTLSLPMYQAIAPGDTFSVVAGCRKRLAEDCYAKFANQLNFQGEPHLPGIDTLTAAPV